MLSRVKTDTAIQLVNNIPLLAITINNRSLPFLLCRGMFLGGDKA
jgi:hypothetical protein